MNRRDCVETRPQPVRVEYRFEVAAKTFVAGIPTSCLSARSMENEVSHLKSFITRPLRHNAEMDWHRSPSDRDHYVAEIALHQDVDASKMNATSVGIGWKRGVNSSQRLCNDRETT